MSGFVRTDKQLLIASKAFASDDRLRSWWYLISTMSLYLACLATCFAPLPIWLRLIPSVISGLLIVRLFIIYHDYQHKTILAKSKLAGAIMNLYGMLVLSPASVWNRSHDHHHKHNCKQTRDHVGSFPIMTCDEYAKATRWEKLFYRIARHPITIALGYFTVFLGGMCIRPMLKDPRRHIDSSIALVLHIGIAVGLAFLGWEYPILCLFLPLMVACGVGSYLFYAQHNFPGCKLNARERWSHVGAALVSSSYMRMHPVMHWFTGNIGYHHVHHLNAKIPFYRLTEAMRSLTELQKPPSTSLSLHDIRECFKVNLWDQAQNSFVTYADAKQAAMAATTA